MEHGTSFISSPALPFRSNPVPFPSVNKKKRSFVARTNYEQVLHVSIKFSFITLKHLYFQILDVTVSGSQENDYWEFIVRSERLVHCSSY